MHLRPVWNFFAVGTLLLAVTGCQQSDAPPSPPTFAPAPLAADTVLRVHWAGKHTLGVAASAYSLMRLWEQPESKQLQGYVLSRLSASLGSGKTDAAPGGPSAALAPLLDDLVDREWFLEIRQQTNASSRLVFAIRVDPARALTWRVNLAGALSTITGVHPTTRAESWTLKDPRTQQVLELTRAGEWILLGVALDKNDVLEETAARIRQHQSPGGWLEAGSWLELNADLGWVGGKLLASPPPGPPLPRLALTLTGDGAHVLTRATLDFAEPLKLNLSPWAFPTNRIEGALAGFTALRGMERWLASTEVWRSVALGDAPDQCFIWADAAAPLQMHFAARTPAAADVRKQSVVWLDRGNAWLAQNGLGKLAALPDGVGIAWQGLPLISPHITSTGADPGAWLVGAVMGAGSAPAEVPPAVYPRLSVPDLIADIQSRSNLVAYAWETTGVRAESFYLLSQVLRVARLHPQLPAEAPSSQWIQAVRQRLGNATTTVTLTAPDQLTLERRSTTGLTAAELHLLSDWLESPDFPRGLHSTRTRRAASAAEFQGQP